MKEILYAAEKTFLERYLKEKASASIADMGAVSGLWDRPIPGPGTPEAVDEIYSLDGDTARIKIEGPLSTEGPDRWDRFWGYGGASYRTIRAAMERAKTDPAAARVIFDIDSPGGTVAGADETWQAHKALAAVKKTEVHAGSILASAAYYISAAAGKILAAAPTSEIGSIGVVVAAYDWSKFEEDLGVKRVVITSSNAPDKYSDIATRKGRDTIKAKLDAIERIFYSRVSEGRGYSPDHIKEHFGQGGLLVAADPGLDKPDAVSAGMIDGLTNGDYVTGKPFPGPKMTAEEKKEIAAYIESLDPSSEGTNKPAEAGINEEGQMDLSELLKANPAAAAEIERMKAGAEQAGLEKAKAELAARVDRVMPVITSEAYPANIKAIAGNVLAGKEDMAAFTAAVAVYDTETERRKSEQAQAETAEQGGVVPAAPSLTSAAEKEIDAAVKAELEKRKVK